MILIDQGEHNSVYYSENHGFWALLTLLFTLLRETSAGKVVEGEKLP